MKSFLSLFIGLVLSFALLNACQPSVNQEQGMGYTEYINAQVLVKSVVEQYPNQQDKAVVFTVEGDPEQAIVKEVHYFENGVIQVEGTLKNKERHGLWTFYYDNGKVWSTGEFDMGKSVGIFQIFDPEGQLKIKSYYLAGKKVKEDYFSKGEMIKTVDLK